MHAHAVLIACTTYISASERDFANEACSKRQLSDVRPASEGLNFLSIMLAFQELIMHGKIILITLYYAYLALAILLASPLQY